jgi:hypothetical protein
MGGINDSTDYDVTVTGSIAALNGTVELDPVQKDSQCVSISGTWTATVVFEITTNGTSWFSTNAINMSTGAVVANTTANGNFIVLTAGCSKSRVRASAFTSGSIVVNNEGSEFSQAIVAIQTNPDSLQTTNPTIGNNDTTVTSKSSLIAGRYTAGNTMIPIQVDDQGRLVTSAITGFGADFAFGDITAAAVTRVPLRRTAYTEQTTNAQRSIASASASDTAAGTGARTVLITYYDQTGAGPFTETVTLNGTTYVNTVATNICFIEQMEVVTAGSTGSNVGILTLKAATAGGGATIGTINATDNQTFWAHHYIATGKVCNITGLSCGHNGTTVGSGALFTLQARPIGVTNAIEKQVSDFVRLYGQSSTFARSYVSPIKVTGPARIQIYVTPETSTSTIYRCAIDFFEP